MLGKQSSESKLHSKEKKIQSRLHSRRDYTWSSFFWFFGGWLWIIFLFCGIQCHTLREKEGLSSKKTFVIKKTEKRFWKENSVFPLSSCIMTVNKSRRVRWVLYVVRMNVLRISYNFWSEYFKGRFHLGDMEVRTYTLKIKSCKLLAFQKQIMKMLNGMNCTRFRVECPAIYKTIISIAVA
jgi:hypothetical protein